jgi:hypothetical protein
MMQKDEFKKGIALMQEIAYICRKNAQTTACLVAVNQRTVMDMWRHYVEAWKYDAMIKIAQDKLRKS